MPTTTNNISLKKIARYATSSSARAQDHVTVLDGLHIVQEALRHGDPQRLTHIFYTQTATQNAEIDTLLSEIDPAIATMISDSVMKKSAPTKTPSGILGVYRVPDAPTELSPQADCILLLDHISDPGNLGAIIRTAVAMGVGAIFCSPGCADVWSPKVLRAAQGAHFYTTIFPQFDLSSIKEIFDGRIIGTFLDADATSLYETTLTGKVGFCVGNEGAGLDPETFAHYGDEKIYIPMTAGFESLNVGIATGMCLSEKRRQDHAL